MKLLPKLETLSVFGVALSVVATVACGAGDEAVKGDPTPPPQIEPAPTLDAYVLGNYDEARDRFRASGQVLTKRYAHVEIEVIDIASTMDDDLTVDTIFVPGQKSQQKLLIVSSGVHGIEGFVGSAVHEMFMAEVLPNVNMDTLSILL